MGKAKYGSEVSEAASSAVAARSANLLLLGISGGAWDPEGNAKTNVEGGVLAQAPAKSGVSCLGRLDSGAAEGSAGEEEGC